MSYKRQLRGLGDASSCGAGQTFYPNVTFAGVKGQCLTSDQYNTCKSTGMYAGQPCVVDGGGPSTGETVGNILGALLGGLINKPQATPAPVVVQSGMSTTTKVALVGGGAVVLALLLARR